MIMKKVLFTLVSFCIVTLLNAQCNYERKLINPQLTDEDLVGILFVDDTLGYSVGESNALIRTIDGGATWESIDVPEFENRNVKYGMVMNESRDTIIMYGTEMFVADKYFNNVDRFNPSDATEELNFILFYNTPKGYWFARDNDGGINLHISKDKGSTWEAVEELQFLDQYEGVVDIHFLNSEIGFAVTSFGKIYKTLDGGDSWGLFYSNNSYYFNCLDAVNEENLFIGSSNGILKTKNGGSSWELITLTDNSDVVSGIDFITADSGYVTTNNGYTQQSNFFKTVNGGLSWEKVNQFEDSYNQAFNSFFFKGNKAFLSGRFGLITEINLINKDYKIFSGENTPWLRKADSNSKDDIIAVGEDGQFMISTDKGNTFDIKKLPYDDLFFEYIEYYNDDTIMLVGGDKSSSMGIVLLSTDGGDIWNEIYKLTNDNFRYADINENGAILAVGKDSLHYSDNFGKDWQKFEPLVLTGSQSLNSTKFVNDSTWLVMSFGEDVHITRTTDYGQSWENVYTDDNGYRIIHSIHFINDAIGYLCGNYSLLLKTVDAGKTWISMNEISQTNIYECVLFYDEQNGYIVAGYMLYQTSNGGETWSLIEDSRFANETEDICILEDKSLVVFGRGGTIIKFSAEQLKDLTFENDEYTICQEQNLEFEFPMEYNVIYNWFLDDNLVSNTNKLSKNIDIPDNYTLSFIRQNSCDIKDTITTNINVLDLIISDKPLITLLNDTLFTDADNEIVWYYNGEAILNSNENFIVPTGYGDYEVADSSACGVVMSDVFAYSETTSVDNLTQEVFRVYPNPARDYINISFKNNEAIELVEVYNVMGVRILSVRGNEQNLYNLKTSEFENDIYILRISTNEKQYQKMIQIAH